MGITTGVLAGVLKLSDVAAGDRGVTRERCWKYDWVLEFDIKGLFDNIDHTLLLRAVRKHVTCAWALLYIERWLTVRKRRGDPTFLQVA